MSLEASFLAVDNSEYMRNGDYPPTRLGGVMDACNLVAGAKTQINQESAVGILEMASADGENVKILETLTNDMGRMLSAVSSLKVGGTLRFSVGVQVARMALKHRQNKSQRPRIIAFVGSPMSETKDDLIALATKLKKDGVAVDVVAMGCAENIEKLQAFVDTVGEKSHFIAVVEGASLADVLISSAVIQGEGGEGGRSGAPGVPGGGFEFGVDPNQDPELAMVLRMSMEEELRRQEAESKQKAEQNQDAVSGDAAMTDAGSSPTQIPSGPLSEEQELELAIRLSMEAAMAASNAQSASSAMEEDKKDDRTGVDLTEEEMLQAALKMSMEVETEPALDAIMGDSAFLADVAKGLGVEPSALRKDKEDKDHQ